MEPTQEALNNRQKALQNLNAGRPQNEGITTITSDEMNVPPALNLPPQPQKDGFDFASIPITDIIGGQAPTQAEKDQTDLQKRLLESVQKLGGRTEAQLQAEQTAGLPEAQKRVQELNAQLTSLQAEFQAVPLQIQEESRGRGRTAAGVAPLQNARQRQIAIRALGVGALAQAAQGNLTLAQQTADRAVEMEFAPVEAQLQTLQTAYQLNRDVLEREDKKRSERLGIMLQERERLLKNKKEEKQQIYNVGLLALQEGADQATAQKIFNATSPEEAASFAGNFLGAESKRKLEDQKFERDIKLASLSEDKRQFDLTYKLRQQELSQKEAEQYSSFGDPAQMVAYAQQYASTGKIPTGLPKGTFGAVAQIAKESLKTPGSVIDRNTGVKPDVSDAKIDAFASVYDIVEKAKQLKDLDNKRISGVVSGTLGKIFGSSDQQRYVDLRKEIVDLLSRARTGAALTSSEEAFYSDMLPGRLAEPFFLGPDTQVRIDNFIKQISGNLDTRLNAQGISIVGFSTVDLGGTKYKVGDVIESNGVRGRVLADGSIAIIE